MDYNELLFALHVRNEAKENMRKKFPDPMPEKVRDERLEHEIKYIVHETRGYLKRLTPYLQE